MSRHPTPAREGHWWAKLRLHDNADLNSVNWEVVQVFDNNGEGEFAFMASVPGIEGAQPIDAFVWGPHVPMPEDLRS
jgi:hypothetical protein